MHPILRKFGIGLSAFCAAAFLGWSYLAARQGYWVTVAIALSVCAATLVLTRIMVASTGVSPRAEFITEGTLLRPDRRIDAAVQLMMRTGAVVSWIGLVAAFPFGALYIPLFSELPESFFVIPLWCLGSAVGFTWFWWRFAKGGISSLLLTPEGFSFPTLVGTRAGKWDDITEIRDTLPTGEGRFWDPMVLVLKDGSYCALESPGTYTPGGTALVELVRYYWQHPEQRHELSSDAAVQRLRQLQASIS